MTASQSSPRMKVDCSIARQFSQSQICIRNPACRLTSSYISGFLMPAQKFVQARFLAFTENSSQDKDNAKPAGKCSGRRLSDFPRVFFYDFIKQPCETVIFLLIHFKRFVIMNSMVFCYRRRYGFSFFRKRCRVHYKDPRKALCWREQWRLKVIRINMINIITDRIDYHTYRRVRHQTVFLLQNP